MEVPKFGSFKPRTKPSTAEKEQPSPKEQRTTSARSSSHRIEKRHRSRDREFDRDHYRRHEGQDRDHRRHRDAQGGRHWDSDSKHVRHRSRDAESGLKPDHDEALKHSIPIVQDEFEESNLFIIDHRGDSKNIEYGSLHRYSIPAYRRTGYGNLIGCPLSLKIDREASNEKEIFLISSASGKKEHQKASKLLSSKYGRNSETRLKFVSAIGPSAEEENDFIELSSSRKRKRGSESPQPGLGVDYRSIEGKAKASNKPADADVEYASDSDDARHYDLDLRARQESAILSKKAKANPSVLEPWLALVDHQSQLVRPGVETSALMTSERRTLAELRLSILNEASKTITKGNPGRERLLLAMIEEGTPLWDKSKRAAKWKDVLKECPASILLWTRYMDFVQHDHSSFQFDACKEVYLNWLQVLKAAHAESIGDGRNQVVQIQIYALLRLTAFFRDAGYDELATAIWQVLLEFHFFMPKEVEKISLDARLDSLEYYWDMETPRIGEEGSMTWATFHEDGPSNASRRTPMQTPITTIDSRTPFFSFAREESALANLFLLPASTEDEDAIKDPFRCILFDDLRSVVESLGMGLPKSGLLSAFLHYAGLPPLPYYYTSAVNWNTEPHLANGSDSIKMRSQRESTLSLFESAFQQFRDRHVGGDDSFAKFIDRVLESVLRSEKDQDGSLREYSLAFKAKLFPQESLKAAKKLLKASPTSLRLYNAFALIEVHADRMEKAVGVWDAALGMLPKLASNARDDAVVLWHSRLLTQVAHGEESAALQTLSTITGSEKPSNVEFEDDLSHISQLRLLRHLEAGFDRMLLSENFHFAVLYADLLAWLTYLTQDITSAISSYSHHATSLSKSGPSTAVEDLQQCKARMMTLHMDRRRPYKPSAFQQTIGAALKKFPTNSVLLELHSRIASQDRLRNLVSEQKISGVGEMSVVQWSFKLHAEMQRAGDVVAGGGTVSAVRATAATALLNPESNVAHSVALWKAWLDFEATRGDMKRVRNVFLDGMRALPGVKRWVVDGLSTGCMEEGEMRRVWEDCVERGLRLRVGIESFL